MRTYPPRIGLSRRDFAGRSALAAGALAAASCAPSAAPPAAPAPAASSAPVAQPAAWEKQWTDLIAAAKQEGKLVLVTSIGATYRAAVDAFQEAFPGIEVEHSNIQTTPFVARVQK